MKRCLFNLECISVVIVLLSGISNADTYYSDYGSSRTHNININRGDHTFEVSSIASRKTTMWYVNGTYTGPAEDDDSGFWGIDPSYSYYISTPTEIKAIIIDNESLNVEEYHIWNCNIALPDLIPSDAHASDNSPEPGQLINVFWTVRNRGSSGCDSSNQGIVLSNDPAITKTDQLLRKVPLGPMNPGESENFSYSVNIPGSVIPGKTYYVGIIEDYDNDVSESNENNNTESIRVTIPNPSFPDLIVNDISLSPTEVYSGSNDFGIMIMVRNIGTAPSGNCRLRIQASGLISTIRNVQIPPLSPGQSYMFNDHISGIIHTPGDYNITILAIADYYDEVEESDENNNSRQENFHIIARSSLILKSPDGGEEIPVGSIFTVKWETLGAITAVNLDVSIDSGSTWDVLETNYSNNGQYEWAVTDYWDSPTCLLKVSDASDPAVFDISNNLFQVYSCTLKYDLDGNCFIDLSDVALLATEWLQSGNPYN